MSSSTIMFNREKLHNNDMDANINMVSISKPTRERSKRIEAYAVVDNNFDKMLPYSCDFDHIYASNLKDSNGNCKTSELKQLKELLVLHLDLIQQQSDQLQTKDKLIASLKEENEMLKLRLQRNDRRMTLKRSKDSTQGVSDQKIDSHLSYKDNRNDNSCNSDFSKSSHKMGGNSFLSKKNVLLLESDTNCMLNSTVIASGNVKDELYSNKLPLSEINVLSSVQDMEGFELMNISEGSTSNTYLNGTVSHSKLTSSKKIGRFKRASRESNISRHSSSVVKSDQKINLPSSQVGISKVNKNDENDVNLLDNGSVISKKKHNFSRKSDDECSCDEIIDNSDLMTTDVPYYTITGCPPAEILNEKEIANNSLEIPSWRHKIFTSCYSMEGTENLSDDVFEKRHARLEAEEKRRKRWDVQRIREQRQLDHLRENERKRNWLAKSDDDNEKETSRPCSLYPTISGITRISIDDLLPINALGVLLKKIESSEFSLPWKEGKSGGNGFSYDKDSSPPKLRRK